MNAVAGEVGVSIVSAAEVSGDAGLFAASSAKWGAAAVGWALLKALGGSKCSPATAVSIGVVSAGMGVAMVFAVPAWKQAISSCCKLYSAYSWRPTRCILINMKNRRDRYLDNEVPTVDRTS